MDLADINTKTLEGRYLIAALAKLTTESQRDKTPEEVLAQINKLQEAIFGREQSRHIYSDRKLESFDNYMMDILECALLKGGVLLQLDMAVEECAELIQAINKIKRAGLVSYEIAKPCNRMDLKSTEAYDNLCGEVADVKIMIAQMELMLDKERFITALDLKIERLKTKLS